MLRLWFNHVDAWGATLVIALLAMILHHQLTPQHALLAVALGLGYWLAFALNDYFDAPFDAQDPRKAGRNYFAISGRENGRFLTLAVLSALLITAVFLSYGTPGTALLLLGLLIMWAYSAPPLRLKNIPIIDLLTHTLFVETFPYTVTVILTGGLWQAVDYFILLMLALASLTAQLEQQLRDYDLDKETGGTFATWAGKQTTNRLLKLSTAVLIGTAVTAVATQQIPLWLIPFGLIALPALTHRFLRPPHHPRSERLVLFSVAIGIGYMALLLITHLTGITP